MILHVTLKEVRCIQPPAGGWVFRSNSHLQPPKIAVRFRSVSNPGEEQPDWSDWSISLHPGGSGRRPPVLYLHESFHPDYVKPPAPQRFVRPTVDSEGNDARTSLGKSGMPRVACGGKGGLPNGNTHTCSKQWRQEHVTVLGFLVHQVFVAGGISCPNPSGLPHVIGIFVSWPFRMLQI